MSEYAYSSVESPLFVMRLSSAALPAGVLACKGSEAYQKTMHAIRGEEDYLYAGGYDLVPTRRLGWDTWTGALARLQASEERENGLPFATGVHQPWPQTLAAGFKQGIRTGTSNAKSLAVMPNARTAMATMGRMTEALGTGVTWTVYPGLRDVDGDLIDYTGYVGKHAVRPAAQLEPDAVRHMGAENDLKKFFVSNKNRGIEGAIIDVHHMLRQSNVGNFRFHWGEVLEELKKQRIPLAGVHVSVGREDSKYGQDRFRSTEALRLLMDSPHAFARTREGEIMAEACAMWHMQQRARSIADPDSPRQTLHVTTEIPYIGFAKYLDQSEVDRRTFVKLHAQAARRIHAFFFDRF